jgi:hypothetical protein
MNIPKQHVDFPIAKLLKEKGFDEKCSHYYILDFQNFKADGVLYKTKLPEDCDNSNIFQFVRRSKGQPHLANAPEIWQVVEFLRVEKGIWVSVDWTFVEKKPSTKVRWHFSISNVGNREQCIVMDIPYKSYDSPKEAYLAAFRYCLEKII